MLLGWRLCPPPLDSQPPGSVPEPQVVQSGPRTPRTGVCSLCCRRRRARSSGFSGCSTNAGRTSPLNGCSSTREGQPGAQKGDGCGFESWLCHFLCGDTRGGTLCLSFLLCDMWEWCLLGLSGVGGDRTGAGGVRALCGWPLTGKLLQCGLRSGCHLTGRTHQNLEGKRLQELNSAQQLAGNRRLAAVQTRDQIHRAQRQLFWKMIIRVISFC